MKTDAVSPGAAASAAGGSREILELQLRKTRLQAESVRLEAIATEIEIELRRCALDIAAPQRPRHDVGVSDGEARVGWAAYQRAARRNLAAAGIEAEDGKAESGAAGYAALTRRLPNGMSGDAVTAGATAEASEEGAAPGELESDGALPSRDPEPEPSTEEGSDGPTRVEPTALAAGASGRLRGLARPEASSDGSRHPASSSAQGGALPAAANLHDSERVGLSIVDERDDEEPKRRGRLGWGISAAAHVALVLLLMLITLRTAPPMDAIALSASPAATSEPLEAMELETVEAPEPAAEPVAAAAVESEIGAWEVPVEVVELAPADAERAPLVGSTVGRMTDAGAMLAQVAATDAPATVFCGIEEGGNNLCYIVDRSQSMKNGRFEAARNELLRSIDALPPEKRFYVIFYASTVEPMRLGSRQEPEPYAVPATPQNKAALRRWAMTVGLERGAPPDDALEIALELAPDVIFLLTDGEFPQYVEAMLDEKNSRESLFGDEGPRSIIHTIGFYSRDGETRLKRIAQKNGGKYTYIAEP